MNAFEQLLNLPAAGRRERGCEHTAMEIAQQPAMWSATAKLVRERGRELRQFLSATEDHAGPEPVLILSGAGTSEFIGNAVVNSLRTGLRREVISVPTTHLVTHAAATIVPGHPYLLVSFARSGNSPESIAACECVKRLCPDVRQLVITCNRDGALAKAARADGNALCLELPEPTNDRSLVMTSSFSSMAFAATGLTLLDTPQALPRLAADLGTAADRILHEYGDLLHDMAERPFDRACFLGSNSLCGTMQECHLKMQEMTEGRVACRFDSYLGLRHGPQVFVNDSCIVMAALATDPAARRYEMDLLRELHAKGQGTGLLVVCDRAAPELRALTDAIIELFPAGAAVDDRYRVMTDVVAGQVLAMFTCLKLGLAPDNPSTVGTINRVVQGVTIYRDEAATREQGS